MKSWDEGLAGLIDHTLLRADSRRQDVEKLCEEALLYRFASVCINPCWVGFAKERLKGSGVRVCTVAGFPLGANKTEVKVLEAGQAILDGAQEIDVVINISALKSGNEVLVEKDMREVVRVCHESGAICKVILETAYLTDNEKERVCILAREVGADFVKTSTGFGPVGATVKDVALMRRVVGSQLGVKAAGGIRDQKTARAMLKAGATRIGASAGVKIVRGV